MPKKMFLVDGSNQAFRAFFAIQNDMRGPDGFPTRALYGYAGMLQRLLREYTPDYVAVVFDKGLSFRNDLYPDYKGQRPDMPADLRKQWLEFQPFSEEFGIAAIAQEGFEADDIIGTLATMHAGPDMQVWIVSSDKDFGQLVSEHVRLLDLGKDVDYGPAEIAEKWGVGPDRIIDLLALMGDTSDNVPGVKGVGQKTAVKHLLAFGTCEGVVEAAKDGRIKGKTGERIAEAEADVALSKKLVTIVTDMDEPLTLAQMTVDPPDWPALEARLKRYGFRRMLDWVQQNMGEDATRRTTIDRSIYRTVRSPEALAQLVADLRAAGRFAYDSETTSLDARTAAFVGMSFCWGEADAVYVPIGHAEGDNCPGALDALLPLLADPALEKTGQNLKYDLEVLLGRGHALAGIAGDTMLADYLLDVDRKHGLDALALRYFGHRMISFAEATEGVDGGFEAVPVDRATAYAAEDAHVAWLLDREMNEKMAGTPVADVYRDIELPLVPVLAAMELAGIKVDAAALGELSVELDARITELVAAAHAEAGQEFNLNSPKQLAVILFEERGLPVVKKTKTGPSTAAAVLERLAADGDALCRLILDDGRIHTSFHQAVAATGRLSSNEPNLQNIPIRTADGRRIRACFVPEPGHVFLSCDYSQVELRVLAHFCGQGPLVEAYQQGQDIHRRTASEVFEVAFDDVTPEQRRAAKAINFGIVYGMSAFRLSNELDIPRGEAQAYIDGYFARYPQVRTYMDEAVERAREKGYAETLLGRRRPVQGLDAKNPMDRAAAERIAINTPVQGSAADLIKKAMIAVHARLAAEFPTTRLLLQVHDELVLEVPVGAVDAVRAAVVEEMQGVARLAVPLVVDSGVGATWDEAH
jgi:DNA polymerase-1